MNLRPFALDVAAALLAVLLLGLWIVQGTAARDARVVQSVGVGR